MNPQIESSHSYRIVYDADRLAAPARELFSVQYWDDLGAIKGEAAGRGSTLFIDAPFGEAVLKHYFRGGQIARWNKKNYFFTGYENARPFREFRLLQSMLESGLPVPQPLAAICIRRGFFYRGALLTKRLPGASTLAALLLQQRITEHHWRAIGQCVAGFHRAGILHADLNASNVMLDTRNRVFLVDFDKSKHQNQPGSWQQANLNRLYRSLKKLKQHHGDTLINLEWDTFMTSYRVQYSD